MVGAGGAARQPADGQEGEPDALGLIEEKDQALGFEGVIAAELGECVLGFGNLPAHGRGGQGGAGCAGDGREGGIEGRDDAAFGLVRPNRPEGDGEKGLEQAAADGEQRGLEGL